MHRPKISVIMPAFNSKTYIRESIESVLAQRFTDFELIVVDDGSTDTTGEIVQSYPDDRIKLIRQENQGVSVARNTGLDAAQGEFITFLDSDDLYFPDFLCVLLRLLESTKTDMSFCNFSESYDMKDIYKPSFKKILNLLKDKILGARILKADSPIDYLPMHINSVMISKNLIEKYHIRFLPGVKMFEDRNFLIKSFLAAKRISGIYSCLEHYRRHPDSASFIKYRMLEEAMPVNLRDNETEFAQQYGLNGEFVNRVKRHKIFQTFRHLLKHKKYEEAKRYAHEHDAELTCYAATGERLKDRMRCRLWRILLNRTN